MKPKKGQIWLSAVLYILVAVVILVLILEAGLPFLKGLREQSAFTNVRESVTLLDRQIVQIAGEGAGSQRVIPLDIVDGSFYIEAGKVRWKLETESKVVEPRSRIELGNLIISSDVDVSATQIGNFFILQNSRIRANISKLGSTSNWTNINSSNIINNIQFIDTQDTTEGVFKFSVNGSENYVDGTGYTEIVQQGAGLTSGQIIAHINSTAMEYDIEISLDSKADFLRTRIKNFRRT